MRGRRFQGTNGSRWRGPLHWKEEEAVRKGGRFRERLDGDFEGKVTQARRGKTGIKGVSIALFSKGFDGERGG